MTRAGHHPVPPPWRGPPERRAAHQPNAPGPKRHVGTVTFDQLLADNPRNLVHLFEQYYWAEELA